MLGLQPSTGTKGPNSAMMAFIEPFSDALPGAPTELLLGYIRI